MKYPSLATRLVVVLGLTIVGSLFAAASAPDSRVTVIFEHPEKYKDLKQDDNDGDNERGRAQYLPQIKAHLEAVAGPELASEHKLTITFIDIDLAGEFEYWLEPQFSHVRILKEIYSPRFKFTFQLLDKGGGVLAEGERTLTDLNYLMRIPNPFSSDLLRYEKSLLNEWIAKELKPRKS